MVIVSLGDGVPGNVYCLLRGAPLGGESFVSFEGSSSLKWRLSTWPVVACQMLLEFCCLSVSHGSTGQRMGRGEKREEMEGRAGRLATHCAQGRDRSAGTTLTP